MSLRDGLNVTQTVMETVDGRALGENLTLARIVSEVVHELETQRDTSEAEYEQFLTDVWVGVVLTLMVLSCVCCMCSCLLYHKFQQWKRHVLEERAAASGDPYCRGGDTESLPSYTLVSGLPSYEEALKQLNQAEGPRSDPDHVAIGCGKLAEAVTASPSCPASLNHCGCLQAGQLSIAELLQLCKLQQQQQQDHQNGTDPLQQQRIAKV